jgi:acyl-CoA reductase-like NAD-dependent aldehyde dehydrogenase
MSEHKLLIGGEWRIGSGAEIVSLSPVTGAEVARFKGASLQDVDEAVAAAKLAVKDPGWRDLKPHQRARILSAIGDEIEQEIEGIAQLQTLDTGKCLYETRGLATSAAATFRYMAAALETMDETITTSRGDYLTMSVHEPIGIIGAITPWNSPIASDAQKIAPALAAGNAVILKPAAWTPLVSLMLGEICLEAGLPKGLLSVLPGSGSIVGDRIVRHPDIGKVSFTGGTNTGRGIASIAADKLMPVSLELGGKSPTIVFADADIDHAINGVMYGVFSSTGQSCIAGSRLFVARAIYDDFVQKLVERTKALIIGKPTDPETQVAPMVSFEHRDSVAAYVNLAREEGADVLCGGGVPSAEQYSTGAYYEPTILAGLDNTARVCQEEIFGPVLIVLPFDDIDSLIEQANDSVYGLACGIWTTNFQKAYKVARSIEAGTVWINTYKQFSISTPFGGTKESGLGREKGRKGIQEYMQQKSLYIGLNESPLAWAD